MANIVPTITASDTHHYREQMERVDSFAPRMHIDFADGKLAPTELLVPAQAWVPDNKVIDLHLMYRNPMEVLDAAIRLRPQLIIIHAEAEAAAEALQKIRNASIKTGIAVLPNTQIETIHELFKNADHVLVFGGQLGYQGGEADLSLLSKVPALKQLSRQIEIGWDGGVNDQNAKQLIEAGVDVLNVGGFIQQAEDPANAYAKLLALADATNGKNTLA